jgi:hypothetical protein
MFNNQYTNLLNTNMILNPKTENNNVVLEQKMDKLISTIENKEGMVFNYDKSGAKAYRISEGKITEIANKDVRFVSNIL